MYLETTSCQAKKAIESTLMVAFITCNSVIGMHIYVAVS